jgi:hypothetical protein
MRCLDFRVGDRYSPAIEKGLGLSVQRGLSAAWLQVTGVAPATPTAALSGSTLKPPALPGDSECIIGTDSRVSSLHNTCEANK